MSALLGKAGKKLFEKHMEQYAPADPLYEYYMDDRGKKKRRKRELPPGLSARDAKILKSIKKRAHYLDKGFSICGLRFGWTFVIGIIPGLGDVVDAGLNYFLVVRKARQAEIPGWLLRRMLVNNLISAVTGFVPFIGDVILAIFKANSRNAALLEEFLRIRGVEYLRLSEEGKDVAAVVDPKDGKTEKRGKGADNKSTTGEPKSAEIVKGVTKSDAQQVKPGAGREKDEVVPLEPTAPSPDVVPGGTLPKATTSNGTSTSSRKSGSRRSFKAWIAGGGNGKDKQKGMQVGERGRFVEDVDETGGMLKDRK